jgi:uncharacterized RDD family membrane protein YckC
MPHGLLGHYAGFTSRFIAFFIDVIVVTVTLSLMVWAFVITQSLLQLGPLAEALRLEAAIPAWLQQFLATSGPVLVGLFGSIIYIAYNLFFWSTTGRTPGKAFMGLRVVTVNGKRLSLLRAILRLIGYLLSALPLYLGFLWTLIDDRRQGWHDKLAGTCVVYTWAARPDERFLAYQLRRMAATRSKQE